MPTILVVDDDPDILMITEAALEDEGYRVIATTDGREALRLAVDERADAVVLDVNMPEISGYEVLAVLRGDSRCKDLPILFLSARGATKDRIQGLREGADDYLTKPFELEELMLRMEKLLSMRASLDDTDSTNTAFDLQEALHQGSVDGMDLGRYELRRKIASGAMGLVMLGFDPRLRREVAIKTIRFDRLEQHDLDHLLDDLLNEAAAIARIKHPNIVIVHDVDRLNDLVYVVMEYLDGPNLGTLLRDRSRLSDRDTVALGLAVARALGAAHDAGIVHRDIKPDNILLGNNSSIKVTDFGIADSVSEPGKICGTPGFIAPETLHGEESGPPCDFFSLGAVLYLCLTGERAFPGKNHYAVLASTIQRDPLPPQDAYPGISPQLSALIIELLSKAPEQRPQSAEEVESRLLQIFPEEPRWNLNFDRSSQDTEEIYPTRLIGTQEIPEVPRSFAG